MHHLVAAVALGALLGAAAGMALAWRKYLDAGETRQERR